MATGKRRLKKVTARRPAGDKPKRLPTPAAKPPRKSQGLRIDIESFRASGKRRPKKSAARRPAGDKPKAKSRAKPRKTTKAKPKRLPKAKSRAKPRKTTKAKPTPAAKPPRKSQGLRIDIESFRASQAAAKNEAHAKGRDIIIPACEDWGRRLQLEKDTPEWCRWYFPSPIFWHPFTDDELEMVEAIETCAQFGTDQAIAGPRGCGKTTIAVHVVLKAVMVGLLSFPTMFAANATKAEDELLGNLKSAFEESDRLAADYPEICVPIRELEGINNRCRGQTVSGTCRAGHPTEEGEEYVRWRTRMIWAGKRIRLPDVPGSPCAGAMFGCYGLDAAIRGANVKGRRPDLALIDDADTEDTADNPEQAAKLERKIDRGIAGLAGQGKRLARVMLCTVPSRTAVAFIFTDPQKKPSWNGKRYKLLAKPPDRADLWDDYIAQRITDQQEGDRFGRKAHAMYLTQRKAMDAGAEISNPYRFVADTLPDGSQVEVSTLQFFYNEVARLGLDAVLTEYQNDPPQEAAVSELTLSPSRVQCQVSGWPRLCVPPGCTILTLGADVKKIAIHWVIRAWRPEAEGWATGFTIGYGVTEVKGITRDSEVGLDEALLAALHDLQDAALEKPCRTPDGTVVPINLALIDSKWRKEAVYRFCDEAGRGWYPAIGYGRSSGCISPNFREPVESNPKKIMGWQMFSAPRPGGGGWLIHVNADHYKSWEHDRWRSDPKRAGALLVYGEPGRGPKRSEMSGDEKDHHAYAHHICAEAEVEEPVRGVMRRYWKEKSHNNHWLDASYRATVAAPMCGVRLYGMPVAPVTEEVVRKTGVTMPDGSPYYVMERE